MISSALLNPIRVWSTKTRRLKCQILLLPDEQSVVLSEAGEVLYATKNSLEQLDYHAVR